MAHDRYISPFSTRYASDEMQYTFSDDNKFRTWRRLWIALAKAEQKQGLDITDEQIAELEARISEIDTEMSDPAIGTQVAKLQELTKEQAACQEQLEKLYEQWEELAE